MLARVLASTACVVCSVSYVVSLHFSLPKKSSPEQPLEELILGSTHAILPPSKEILEFPGDMLLSSAVFASDCHIISVPAVVPRGVVAIPTSTLISIESYEFNIVVSTSNEPSISYRPTSIPTPACGGNSIYPTPLPQSNPAAHPFPCPPNQQTEPTTPPTASITRIPSMFTSSPTATTPFNRPSVPPSTPPTYDPSEPVSKAPNVPPTAAPTAASTTASSLESPASAQPTIIPTPEPVAPLTAAPTPATPSFTPTAVPVEPPTAVPTAPPTVIPSATPISAAPSSAPTTAPVEPPTAAPTAPPTAIPSATPTSAAPSSAPTTAPVEPPTAAPTAPPTTTTSPSATPSSVVPSSAPSAAPSAPPTAVPTAAPTTTPSPSATPTSVAPSSAPSAAPSAPPTTVPTAAPTTCPSATPTSVAPSSAPSAAPSAAAITSAPTAALTLGPTEADTSAVPSTAQTSAPIVPSTTTPTAAPTPILSTAPTAGPALPSFTPTILRSTSPTNAPTTASPTLAETTPSPTLAPTSRSMFSFLLVNSTLTAERPPSDDDTYLVISAVCAVVNSTTDDTAMRWQRANNVDMAVSYVAPNQQIVWNCTVSLPSRVVSSNFNLTFLQYEVRRLSTQANITSPLRYAALCPSTQSADACLDRWMLNSGVGGEDPQVSHRSECKEDTAQWRRLFGRWYAAWIIAQMCAWAAMVVWVLLQLLRLSTGRVVALLCIWCSVVHMVYFLVVVVDYYLPSTGQDQLTCIEFAFVPGSAMDRMKTDFIDGFVAVHRALAFPILTVVGCFRIGSYLFTVLRLLEGPLFWTRQCFAVASTFSFVLAACAVVAAIALFGFWALQAPCSSPEQCMTRLNQLGLWVQLGAGVAVGVVSAAAIGLGHLLLATIANEAEDSALRERTTEMAKILPVYLLFAALTACTAFEAVLEEPIAALVLYVTLGRVVSLLFVYSTCRSVHSLPALTAAAADEEQQAGITDSNAEGQSSTVTAPPAADDSPTVPLDAVYPNHAALMQSPTQYVVQFDYQVYTIHMRHQRQQLRGSP